MRSCQDLLFIFADRTWSSYVSGFLAIRFNYLAYLGFCLKPMNTVSLSLISVILWGGLFSAEALTALRGVSACKSGFATDEHDLFYRTQIGVILEAEFTDWVLLEF